MNLYKGSYSDALSSTLSAMRIHPHHIVIPTHRKVIYDLFDKKNQGLFHKWLGIITAKYVLPIWERTSENKTPRELISTSERILTGIEDNTRGETLVNYAWEWLEQLGNLPLRIPIFSYYAAEASLASLLEVLGRIPFSDIVMDEKTTDEMLDVWTSDVAKFASIAVAGRVDSPQSNTVRRMQFYEWWISTAIPEAVDMAHQYKLEQ